MSELFCWPRETFSSLPFAAFAMSAVAVGNGMFENEETSATDWLNDDTDNKENNQKPMSPLSSVCHFPSSIFPSFVYPFGFASFAVPSVSAATNFETSPDCFVAPATSPEARVPCEDNELFSHKSLSPEPKHTPKPGWDDALVQKILTARANKFVEMHAKKLLKARQQHKSRSGVRKKFRYSSKSADPIRVQLLKHRFNLAKAEMWKELDRNLLWSTLGSRVDKQT